MTVRKMTWIQMRCILIVSKANKSIKCELEWDIFREALVALASKIITRKKEWTSDKILDVKKWRQKTMPRYGTDYITLRN